MVDELTQALTEYRMPSGWRYSCRRGQPIILALRHPANQPSP